MDMRGSERFDDEDPMNEKSGNTAKVAFVALFLTVFLAVFFLVVITTTLVTFILPESYASATRIRLDRPSAEDVVATNTTGPTSSAYDPYSMQTEFEIIHSEAVLRNVIEDLGLNAAWGKKYAGGQTLKTMDSLALLKQRLEVRLVRGTSLIEIRVYSDEPAETAKLANGITKSYAKYTAEGRRGFRVELLDKASPPIRPVRPNKPLNITLGVVIGLVLGSGCAGFAVWLALVFQRRRRAEIPHG